MNVKAAVVVLIIPNIVMDGLQFIRLGAPMTTVRRFASLLVFGAVGTAVGTRLLVALSARTATLILGAFILGFVVLATTGVAPRVPKRWEAWTSPVAGLVAGVVGGITNVPGTPLVMCFHALGPATQDFVSSVSFTFVVYKLIQLAAVAYYGLLTRSLLVPSFLLTLVAVVGFAVGLMVQDRLEQRTFNRLVLGFLTVLGIWLVARSLR